MLAKPPPTQQQQQQQHGAPPLAERSPLGPAGWLLGRNATPAQPTAAGSPAVRGSGRALQLAVVPCSGLLDDADLLAGRPLDPALQPAAAGPSLAVQARDTTTTDAGVPRYASLGGR